MTDKTDLIEQNDNPLITMIADLGDITIDKRRRWSIEFDDYGIQGVIDVLKQHFIESDEAREYWQEQLYDIQQRAVQLAVMLEKQHFIEQACDAVHTLFKDNGLQKDIYYTDIAQAIRDKFNP